MDIPSTKIQRSDTSDTESDDGINIIIRDFKSYGQLISSISSSNNFRPRKKLFSVIDFETSKFISNTNTVKSDSIQVRNKQCVKRVVTEIVRNDFKNKFYEEKCESLNIQQEFNEIQTIPVLTSIKCNNNSKKRKRGIDPFNLKIITGAEVESFTFERTNNNNKGLEKVENKFHYTMEPRNDIPYYQKSLELTLNRILTPTQDDQRRSSYSFHKSFKLVQKCISDDDPYYNFIKPIQNKQCKSRDEKSPKHILNIIPKSTQDKQSSDDSCFEESLDSVLECTSNDNNNILEPLQNKQKSNKSNCKVLPESKSECWFDLNSTEDSQMSDYHSMQSTSTQSWISDDAKEPLEISVAWNNRHRSRSRNKRYDCNRRRNRSWSRSERRTSSPSRFPQTSRDRSRSRYRDRKRDKSSSSRGTAASRSPPTYFTRDGMEWQESSKMFAKWRSEGPNRSRGRRYSRYRDRSRSTSRSRRYKVQSRSPPRKRCRIL